MTILNVPSIEYLFFSFFLQDFLSKINVPSIIFELQITLARAFHIPLFLSRQSDMRLDQTHGTFFNISEKSSELLGQHNLRRGCVN